MKIAFDLDDTLFQTTKEFPTNNHWVKFIFREKLRCGTVELLKNIHLQGHDIWIYTTSLRNEYYLRLYFLTLGIYLAGVVNYTKHMRRMKSVKGEFSNASKYPPTFGIDLLIDDSEGVKLEGNKYGFTVFHINYKNLKWVENILEFIEMKETVVLYRPTDENELELVKNSGYLKWPPRLSGQPIFYPVSNEEYAKEIATKWNIKDSGVGYVTKFKVNKSFMDKYSLQTVGGKNHTEWWIPANELEELNNNIVGEIEIIGEYRKT